MPIERINGVSLVHGKLTPVATITIDLLPDGRYGMAATFLGNRDSSYAPFSPDRLLAEVDKLRKELEDQVSSVKTHALCLCKRLDRLPQRI